MRRGRAAVLLPALGALSLTVGMVASLLLYEKSAWSTLPFAVGVAVELLCLRLAVPHIDAYLEYRAGQGQAAPRYEHLTPFSSGYLSFHASAGGLPPRVVIAIVWACCTSPILFFVFLWVNAAIELARGAAQLGGS
jgi:hypothetical protein